MIIVLIVLIAYLLLVIWFLAGLFWFIDAIRKIDDEMSPETNSEYREKELDVRILDSILSSYCLYHKLLNKKPKKLKENGGEMMKLPKKKVIVNRIRGYIERLETEKTKREDIDVLFVLKNILRDESIGQKIIKRIRKDLNPKEKREEVTCEKCGTELKHVSAETIFGELVWADDYSKPWSIYDKYCPVCNPVSLEDYLLRKTK